MADAPRTTNVQVAVRCRPANAEEKKLGLPLVINCDSENKAVKVSYGPSGKKTSKIFQFDKVFGMYSTQEEVFQAMVSPIVDEVLAGFNCTIFAYGQTGTGKTHTMEGEVNSEENAGIVPRSVRAIFENLEANGMEFTIRVSFLELYNEELQDLLSDGSDKDKRLRLCEDLKKGVVCQNLEEVTVLNVNHIFDILKKGIEQRQTAATLMNKNSSRSHSIFTMKIMIKETSMDGEEIVRHGQLNLVDLAGSECVGRSGAKDARAREAGSINQSLLTLGRVITALVDHHGHIPYRDSKLTRLLQESLGGKTKTCIIATMSPSQAAVDETLSTLDYANRAKSIKNAPQINQKTTKKVLLKEYGAEIEHLRTQLQITREKNGIYMDPVEYEEMNSRISAQDIQLTECESALRSRSEEVKTLRVERDTLSESFDQVSSTLQLTSEQLEVSKVQLTKATEELQTTQVELDVTLSVVHEQVQTEETLLKQASELQREVQDRRSDIEALLGKVDRHITNEQERIDEAGKFVNTVDNNRKEMILSVNEMLRQSKDNSSELCQGVDQMIYRGHETCEKLQSAIQGALSVLLVDAENAKDHMTEACDGLVDHLHNTNNNLAATLQGMQVELSSWLGDLDGSLRNAKKLLNDQEQQIVTFGNSISTQIDLYTQTNSEIMQKQEEKFQETQLKTEALHMDLLSKINTYESLQQTQLEVASISAKEKTAAIEKSISSMLQSLLADQLSAFGTSSHMCSEFSSTLQDHSNTTTKEVLASSLENHKNAVDGYKLLSSMVESSAREHLGQLQCIQSTRSSTVSSIQSISENVLDRQTVLNDTVQNVLSDLTAAMDHGCDVVRHTSTTAESILGDVTRASDAMSKSSQAATGSFATFLSNEGKEISNKLGYHFTGLEEHLEGTNEVLLQLGDEAQSFGEEAATSSLRPTGATPKKRAYFQLSEIRGTRDHDIIKAETRSKILPIQIGLSNTKGSSSIGIEIENDANSENQNPQNGQQRVLPTRRSFGSNLSH